MEQRSNQKIASIQHRQQGLKRGSARVLTLSNSTNLEQLQVLLLQLFVLCFELKPLLVHLLQIGSHAMKRNAYKKDAWKCWAQPINQAEAHMRVLCMMSQQLALLVK
eukprot:1159668-Pelagomonas_calceolata.AAC.16